MTRCADAVVATAITGSVPFQRLHEASPRQGVGRLCFVFKVLGVVKFRCAECLRMGVGFEPCRGQVHETAAVFGVGRTEGEAGEPQAGTDV